MAVSPQQIESTVAAHFAALRALDADGWLRTFAPDAVSYDPAGGVAPARTGHDELRPVIAGAAATFGSADFREESVFVTGNAAAVKWTARCVTREGKDVAFEGIDVFEFNDLGTIQTMYAYWNPALLAPQLQS